MKSFTKRETTRSLVLQAADIFEKLKKENERKAIKINWKEWGKDESKYSSDDDSKNAFNNDDEDDGNKHDVDD